MGRGRLIRVGSVAAACLGLIVLGGCSSDGAQSSSSSQSSSSGDSPAFHVGEDRAANCSAGEICEDYLRTEHTGLDVGDADVHGLTAGKRGSAGEESVDITEVAPTDPCGDGGTTEDSEQYRVTEQGNRSEVITFTIEEADVPDDPASFQLCVGSSSPFTTAEGGQANLDQTDHLYWGHLPDCPTAAAGQVMCAHKELNEGRLEIRYQLAAAGASKRGQTAQGFTSGVDWPGPNPTGDQANQNGAA